MGAKVGIKLPVQQLVRERLRMATNISTMNQDELLEWIDSSGGIRKIGINGHELKQLCMRIEKLTQVGTSLSTEARR